VNGPTILKFYADDHHRLDEWLLRFRDLRGKEPQEAREALRRFRSGLEHLVPKSFPLALVHLTSGLGLIGSRYSQSVQ
jgi:hypothetical protein